VRANVGAIGYVELAYALQNGLPWALVRNNAGYFLEPNLGTTTAAAEGVSLPADMKVVVTDSSNPDAYPIVGFTWILARQQQDDQAKGKTLVDLLWWMVHDGQAYAPELLYAPLSTSAAERAEAQIRSITYQGQPLLGR